MVTVALEEMTEVVKVAMVVAGTVEGVEDKEKVTEYRHIGT